MGRQLSEHTGWPLYSIDNHGDPGTSRWARLLRQVNQAGGTVIVESCLIPPAYRAVLNHTPHVVVEITASDAVRRRRLRERGDAGMRLTKPVPSADLTVPTGTPAGGIADRIGSAFDRKPNARAKSSTSEARPVRDENPANPVPEPNIGGGGYPQREPAGHRAPSRLGICTYSTFPVRDGAAA